MARSRFVSGETVRLDLSDDDWIEVKAELSYGEQQSLIAGLVSISGNTLGETPELGFDLAEASLMDMVMWIVDWSFVDAQDKKVPVNIHAIRNLRPADAAEVEAALMAHKESVEKNALTTIGSDEPATK